MSSQNLICKLLIVGVLFSFSINNTKAQSTTVIEQDRKIPLLLDLKMKMAAEGEIIDGYTIQLYYGTREEADKVLKNYKGKYIQWKASIKYETPNYKVWVGNFTKRIGADRALLKIQKYFPTAFILKPKKEADE